MTEETKTYRECFLAPAGKRVLTHLLMDMGFWDDNLSTPQDIAVANYAKKIIKRLGCINLNDMEFFTEALLNAPQTGE